LPWFSQLADFYSFWAEMIELLDSPQPQQTGGLRRRQPELIVLLNSDPEDDDGGGGDRSRERAPAAPGQPAQLPHSLDESISFHLLIDIPVMEFFSTIVAC
jgi:hypothetical protein